MYLPPELLDAVSLTLRVFDGTAKRLVGDDIQTIENSIAEAESFSNPSLIFTLAIQAMIYSGYSRAAVMAILARMTRNERGVLTEQDFNLLSQSLDTALFEVYRDADSLDIGEAVDFQKMKSEIESLAEYAAAYPASHADLAVDQLKSVTLKVRFVLIPLLNSEHQTYVAKLITAYLNCIEKFGLRHVSTAYLLEILRHSIVAPRLCYCLSALRELRAAARKVSELQVNASPTFAATETENSRFLAFKFLILTDDIARQLKVLNYFSAEGLSSTVDNKVNFSINCACWAQETTNDQSLITSIEDLFHSVKSLPQTPRFLSMCMRFGDEIRGEKWIAMMNKRPATVTTRYLEAQFVRSVGDAARSLQFAARPLSVYSKAFVAMKRDTSVDSDFVKSTNSLAHVGAGVLYGLVRVAQEAIFRRDLDNFSLNCTGSEIDKKQLQSVVNTTIVVAPNHLPFVAQLPIPAIELARMEGAEVVSMVKGLFPSSVDLSFAANVLRDRLIAPYYFIDDNASYSISDDWKIDLANKAVTYHGINYYAGIANSLGIIFRRFTLEFDDPLVAAQVNRHLVMFQSIHDIFSEFLSVCDRTRSYRFLIIGIQYGVGYALRRLIMAAKRSNISIVHASNGYEAFDAEWQLDPEGRNYIASYHSVCDLTKLPDTPLGFRPTPADCKTPVFSSMTQYMSHEVTAAYVQKIDSRQLAALDRKLNEPKGRRRVLLLGTILPDLSIPEDCGFVHNDISEWVHNSAAIADQSDNVTLVIKQHPAELNHKIGFYVAERFVDLIPQGMRNVEILPYNVPFHDAVVNSDLVVLWSGTSSIELALCNVPYVACSRYAQEEYPLYAPIPLTLKDYQDMLLGRKCVQSAKDARLRAADIIYRTSTSPVREPSMWPKRQLLNAQVWPVQIDPALSAELIRAHSTINLAKRILGEK